MSFRRAGWAAFSRHRHGGGRGGLLFLGSMPPLRLPARGAIARASARAAHAFPGPRGGLISPAANGARCRGPGTCGNDLLPFSRAPLSGRTQ